MAMFSVLVGLVDHVYRTGNQTQVRYMEDKLSVSSLYLHTFFYLNK